MPAGPRYLKRMSGDDALKWFRWLQADAKDAWLCDDPVEYPFRDALGCQWAAHSTGTASAPSP